MLFLPSEPRVLRFQSFRELNLTVRLVHPAVIQPHDLFYCSSQCISPWNCQTLFVCGTRESEITMPTTSKRLTTKSGVVLPSKKTLKNVSCHSDSDRIIIHYCKASPVPAKKLMSMNPVPSIGSGNGSDSSTKRSGGRKWRSLREKQKNSCFESIWI